MTDRPSLILIVGALLVGLTGLRLGIRMPSPKGPTVVEAWQRIWRMAAFVGGAIGLALGMVNLCRWFCSP